MNRERIIAAVIFRSKELAGRVRLQKMIYLLDQLGMNSGFSYEYHHYGPYSSDLAAATEDAKAFDLISEEFRYREIDGMRYSIFRPNWNEEGDTESFLKEDVALSESVIERLKATNSTVLELAATIHWIYFFEKIHKWRDEVKRRKFPKTEGGKLEESMRLLDELELMPPKG